jgi:hypothetical protein
MELIEIDDASEAIGMLDPDFAYFDDDAEPCEESPSGKCEFLRDNNAGHCLYCGRKSEP